MLCPSCLAIDIDTLFPSSSPSTASTSFHLLHPHFSNLTQSFEDGCELCNAIYTTVLKGYEDSEAGKRKFGLLGKRNLPVSLRLREFGKYRAGIEHQGASELWVSIGGEAAGKFEVFVKAGSDSSNQKLISGRPISEDANSTESFSTMLDWLSQCTKEHSSCSQGIKTPGSSKIFFPSRVLDVGPLDGSSEPKLVTRESISNDFLEHDGSYATLSHRWGPSMPIRTTNDTLAARLQTIRMEELPPTFRDAVLVTRNLNFRYLWIDSLCIIQDSPQDWAQEAAQMAAIYLNSKFTIATDASKDCHDGIFKPRPMNFVPIEMKSYSKKREFSLTWFIRQKVDDWETCLRRPRADVLNQKGSTLHSRAWILQEDMLSARTIHFGDQQCFWECRTTSVAEGNIAPLQLSLGVLDIGLDDVSWRWATNKRFLISPDAEPKFQDQPATVSISTGNYLKWYSVLVDYSRRDISFSSDVFPALSGLASAFQPLLNDTYLAGLWKNDLHRGLLWIVDDPDYASYAEPWRAPSWSWASVCGGISDIMTTNFRFPVGNSNAEIISAETTLLGISGVDKPNPFGQISSGSLQIKGRWMNAERWPDFAKTPWKHTFTSITEQDGFMLCNFDNGKPDQLFKTEEKGRILGFLKIAKWGERSDSQGEMCALILESTQKGADEFRRVGIARFLQIDSSWFDGWEMKMLNIV